MKKNQKQIMKRIAGRLFTMPAVDYFTSDLFLRFCQERGLDDAWNGLLDVSENRPDLFGGDVMKNAVVRFLCHILHGRTEEFASLFSQLLAGFMQVVAQPLPLKDLKVDLKDLGCAAENLEKEFLSLKAMQENRMKRGLLFTPGHDR